MALRRVLGTGDAVWLVAGNMIGAGIFITPGLVAGSLPGLGAPLAAWLVGGLLALAGASVYAELGTRFPEAGGDYRYLAEAFGRPWAFLFGWAAILATFSAAAAAMALSVVDQLAAAWGVAIPAPAGRALAVALVVALTGANVLGARVAGWTTAALTLTALVALGGLLGFGLVLSPEKLEVPSAGTGATLTAFGAALVPVFFTYSGWNAAAYLAGEMRDPGRGLPRGLLGGTLVVTAIYLTVNAALLVAVPAEELRGSTSAVIVAVERLVGGGAQRALAVAIGAAILGSTNVTLMAGARIYWAMAVDGLAPSIFRRTNAAGVPATALWIGGTWTALLALAGGIELLVRWTTLAILLLSALTVAGLFVLRWRDPAGGGFRCPGYPWTPLFYLVVAVGVAAASAVREPVEALLGVVVVLAGLGVYGLRRHRLREERDLVRARK